MEIYIKGKNFVVSDRVRDYVEKKIGKLDRYLPDIEEARVEITQEKTKSAQDKNIVQVTLRAAGTILRAEERSNAIYACIDTVTDKIHRQVARYKGKRTDRRHGHHHKRADDEFAMLEQDMMASLAEDDERTIVRVKQFSVNSMNEEEAIEQMELLGHDFFVFFNSEAGRINVLYRRTDTNYGILDPVLA